MRRERREFLVGIDKEEGSGSVRFLFLRMFRIKMT